METELPELACCCQAILKNIFNVQVLISRGCEIAAKYEFLQSPEGDNQVGWQPLATCSFLSHRKSGNR